MNIQSFIDSLQRDYEVSTKAEQDLLIMSNCNNDKQLLLEEEIIEPIGSVGQYVEYTVCFSTQHMHFSVLDEALKYIKALLNDEIVVTELYDEEENNLFGGEIRKYDLVNLSVALLANLFGYSPAYI